MLNCKQFFFLISVLVRDIIDFNKHQNMIIKLIILRIIQKLKLL